MSRQWFSPVWMRARSEVRSRWRATLLLTVLIGLSGAVILTAAAGARRTDSAYPAYLSATNAADYLVGTENSGDNRLYQQVAHLPQVRASGIMAGPPLASETKGQLDEDEGAYVQSVASEDGISGYSVGGMKLNSGHMPDPGHPYEAAANVTLAHRRGLHVGSHFTMYLLPPSALNGTVQPNPSQLRPLTFTITGIGVTSDEVVPIAANDGIPELFLTPAFHRQFDHGAAINFDGAFVRLRPGADRSAFVTAVNRLDRSLASTDGGLFVADLGVHEKRVERAIHPQALALELFAGLVAIGALLAISQIIAREVTMSAADDSVLSAMGFGRLQLASVTVVRLAGPVAAGAAVAVGAAVAASPLMPLGAARLAEPHPGVSVDGLVLGAGAAAMMVVFLAVSAVAAWRVTGHVSGSARGKAPVQKPSRLVEALARAGLRPPAVTGVRMALEPGHGRTSVPVRSATVGIVVAVAAVVAVVTFSANLNRLVSTPRLYGDTWSVGLDAQFNSVSRADISKMLAGLPPTDSVSAGTYGDDVTIDGRSVPTIGVDPIQGSLYPTVVSGRSPSGPSEIALGADTMRTLHRHIGDTVTLVTQGHTALLTVVGQVVLPSFGRGNFTPTDLGQGAETVASVVAQPPAGSGSYNFVLLRFASPALAAAAQPRVVGVAQSNGCYGDTCVLTAGRVLPTDVRSYQRVSATPVVLAALLAALGIAMIGHALVTSVRRRRRDLAVLKTLGFVKRDVAWSVAWQVSTFALIGLAAGVPLGVALGRWLWTLFAHQIGVPPAPVVPLIVLAVVPGVVLLTNAIAALPARAAARTHPAAVFRSE
jgi:hypothetical protein